MLQLKEESTQAQWTRQLLGHPSSGDLKPGSQFLHPLSTLRPRGCSFANIRTARLINLVEDLDEQLEGVLLLVELLGRVVEQRVEELVHERARVANRDFDVVNRAEAGVKRRDRPVDQVLLDGRQQCRNVPCDGSREVATDTHVGVRRGSNASLVVVHVGLKASRDSGQVNRELDAGVEARRKTLDRVENVGPKFLVPICGPA
jgi:hypothetical protein